MKPHFRCYLTLPVAVALLCGQSTLAQTDRVSVNSAGIQGNAASGISLRHAISADGRYVAFDSQASNLVPGDTNAKPDVFLRDRLLGTTERVSVDFAGTQGNDASGSPSVSAAGRYVAFVSSASNLVTGDTNGVSDSFVRDRQLNTTDRVSVDSSGGQSDGGSSGSGISVSADGRYVAFSSGGTNLVSGDTNGFPDIFVRDRLLGTTERVNIDSTWAQALGGGSDEPVISADGRYIAFTSYAPNLVPGDTNSTTDIFVRDRQLGTTERISVNSAGGQGNLDTAGPSVSANGRFVAFFGLANNLVAGDTNGVYDVFVRDRLLGTTERVSVDSSGTQGNARSRTPSISADGRFATFDSEANNLVIGDTNNAFDVFVRDRQQGMTYRVSISSAGNQVNFSSYFPGITADGRYIAFASSANNLVTGDTNGVSDAFVRDRGMLYPSTYCTAGTTTNGCLASVAGAGTPSATSGAGFTISVSTVEGQKQGLIFYGIDNAGFTPLPWGASTSSLCIKSPTQRTPPQTSGGTNNACDGALSIDWNTFIATNPGALGNPFTYGQHVFAQAWFRDPPSPKTTMLSNALEFVVGP